MNKLEKLNKLNELKIKYKRSNKYMLCFSYEDIGELIKLAEENISYRKIPNYIIRGERITISERLYSGLVRSLAWKIEYQDRIQRALEILNSKSWLIDLELYGYLHDILKGEEILLFLRF